MSLRHAKEQNALEHRLPGFICSTSMKIGTQKTILNRVLGYLIPEWYYRRAL